ncbi:MAG TPA: hypothetical protein VFO41_02810, partial [Alphaproteobacteria bacterium]|nr:hypothetical protein [Alphaproteobacteria bacterium]
MWKGAVSDNRRLVRRTGIGLLVASALAGAVVGVAGGTTAPPAEEVRIAESLAAFLRAARAVVGAEQYRINQRSDQDKGLTGEVVVDRAVVLYRESTGTDPSAIDPSSREGRLLRAQIDSVREVIDENQEVINNPTLEFKGFVPAVFGRLVNERFMEKMG